MDPKPGSYVPSTAPVTGYPSAEVGGDDRGRLTRGRRIPPSARAGTGIGKFSASPREGQRASIPML